MISNGRNHDVLLWPSFSYEAHIFLYRSCVSNEKARFVDGISIFLWTWCFSMRNKSFAMKISISQWKAWFPLEIRISYENHHCQWKSALSKPKIMFLNENNKFQWHFQWKRYFILFMRKSSFSYEDLIFQWKSRSSYEAHVLLWIAQIPDEHQHFPMTIIFSYRNCIYSWIPFFLWQTYLFMKVNDSLKSGLHEDHVFMLAFLHE